MLMISVIVLSLAGFFVSFYAYFLERNIKKNNSYKPLCDISDTFSCTKPILSKYGKIVGISNSLIGMAYYLLMVVLALTGQINIMFYASLLSLGISAFLAYILYFKIKSVCLICNAIYVINIALFTVLYLNK